MLGSGELARRVQQAYQMLGCCRLCPRECGVDRLAGQRGSCGAAEAVVVSSWNLHPWEEPPISGQRGSGTIFVSGCTGHCRFCQNYPISQWMRGQEVGVSRLALMMLELQGRGAHNINLVSATHFVPQWLAALLVAAEAGLRLPIVYNCSGYEQVEVLRLLDGVVDIYLPDAKYADDQTAQDLSGFRAYVRHNRQTLREIFRQVGPTLVLDEHGIARRGMIVRHLVLPGGLAGTERVFAWIAQALGVDLHVSLMNQYFPTFKAVEHPLLGRKVTESEYEAATEVVSQLGFANGWLQECATQETEVEA
ncbi:MAG: radical SAM protein [Chloroflexi bacterium]|nr:radical SAM protein [Chloroflexota bacterium]